MYYCIIIIVKTNIVFIKELYKNKIKKNIKFIIFNTYLNAIIFILSNKLYIFYLIC